MRAGKGTGQKNCELGTGTGLSMDFDPASVLFHEAVDRSEAEAGLAGAFGGKEGFEKASRYFRCHSATGVGHRQANISARAGTLILARMLFVNADSRRAQSDRTAFGHRLARIDQEVAEDLVDYSGVGHHQREVLPATLFDFNVVAEEAGGHHELALDDFIQIKRLRLHRVTAHQGQELLGQSVGAGGVGRDALKGLGEGGVLTTLYQQLGIVLEPGNESAEIVRHASGELGRHFSLLMLQQVLLQDALSRNIVRQHQPG